jgi:hypothetical protein
VAQPWYLRVRDVSSGQVGTLEEFEVVLAGPQRCIAAGLPITIPDAGGCLRGNRLRELGKRNTRR